jgi:hypothetical protein
MTAMSSLSGPAIFIVGHIRANFEGFQIWTPFITCNSALSLQLWSLLLYMSPAIASELCPGCPASTRSASVLHLLML